MNPLPVHVVFCLKYSQTAARNQPLNCDVGVEPHAPRGRLGSARCLLARNLRVTRVLRPHHNTFPVLTAASAGPPPATPRQYAPGDEMQCTLISEDKGALPGGGHGMPCGVAVPRANHTGSSTTPECRSPPPWRVGQGVA